MGVAAVAVLVAISAWSILGFLGRDRPRSGVMSVQPSGH
jgi:hypothetical protein